MNRTLMERAKSMLSRADLEKKLWEKKNSTTCYLNDRPPKSALMDKAPIEVWLGKNVSLQHLCVFYYEAYVHVPK